MESKTQFYTSLAYVHLMMWNFISDTIKNKKEQKQWVDLVGRMVGDIATTALGEKAKGKEYGKILEALTENFNLAVKKRKEDMKNADKMIENAISIINQK